jgi:hypothetical protein
VVNVTNPYGRIPCFLDRSLYFFFEVTPQLYSRSNFKYFLISIIIIVTIIFIYLFELQIGFCLVAVILL